MPLDVSYLLSRKSLYTDLNLSNAWSSLKSGEGDSYLAYTTEWQSTVGNYSNLAMVSFTFSVT